MMTTPTVKPTASPIVFLFDCFALEGPASRVDAVVISDGFEGIVVVNSVRLVGGGWDVEAVR